MKTTFSCAATTTCLDNFGSGAYAHDYPMSTLVIVESPTKAKTIAKFLGRGYHVLSSFGHIRDLPKSKIGVDVEHNFEPSYLVPRDKSKTVKELKAAAKKAKTILFATDEDREGEAISWHLAQVLNIDPAVGQRITFHEITKHAIEHAIEHPRAIDLHLVDAQQARRVLDRLVGYKLSPFLWHKVARGLSAGRVQSVAVRLIAEREREILAFVPQEFWSIDATMQAKQGDAFPAALVAIAGKKLDKFAIPNGDDAKKIVTALTGAKYTVSSVETKDKKRSPLAPYTTSTLQQDANNRIGMSAKETMRVAQQLYEGIETTDGHVGLITYMRTDSTSLSEKFLGEAHAYIESAYGKEYGVVESRVFKTKSKGAQEAHEAIRPTDVRRTPESMKSQLQPRAFKLYQLIWQRALATQMAEASVAGTTIDITTTTDQEYTFRSTGSRVTFDGFLRVYSTASKDVILPKVAEGESVQCTTLAPAQHFTEPPARYSDATLVKSMEERGIGRPSTYAPTIATIEARQYVIRDEHKRLQPTDIGLLVNDLLVEHFPTIIDFDFTAEMETRLDDIAEGTKEYAPVLREFYEPFAALLKEKEEMLTKKEITEEKIDRKCPKCEKDLVIKTGRFGRFIACTGYPECSFTEPINKEEKEAQEAVTGEVCELCSKPMVLKRGRFGSFLGCSGYPDCKGIKRIEKKTGVTCPKCTTGEIVEKKSKRGKNFYACNRYPDCDFALWSKPTGEKCPTCSSLLILGAKKSVKCSSATCSFTKDAEEIED